MYTSKYFYSDDACDIFYNDERLAVQTYWKGIFIEGEPFRKIMYAIIDLIQLKQCPLVIADARKMKVITAPDQEWIVNVWYPKALAAGFGYEILIVAPNTFSEHTIRKIVTNHYDEKLVRTIYLHNTTEIPHAMHQLMAGDMD